MRCVSDVSATNVRSVAPEYFGRSGNAWTLLGMQCRSCGETGFGQDVQWCSRCGGDQLTRVDLPSTGQVWSFTVQRNPPPGSRRSTLPEIPYAVALVELDGSGLRVMGPVSASLDEVRIGCAVRLAVRELFAEDATGDEPAKTVVGFEFVRDHQ